MLYSLICYAIEIDAEIEITTTAHSSAKMGGSSNIVCCQLPAMQRSIGFTFVGCRLTSWYKRYIPWSFLLVVICPRLHLRRFNWSNFKLQARDFPKTSQWAWIAVRHSLLYSWYDVYFSFLQLSLVVCWPLETLPTLKFRLRGWLTKDHMGRCSGEYGRAMMLQWRTSHLARWVRKKWMLSRERSLSWTVSSIPTLSWCWGCVIPRPGWPLLWSLFLVVHYTKYINMLM